MTDNFWEENKCNRCGQCCMLQIRGNPRNIRPCRYLIIHADETTSCSVYERRAKKLARGELEYLGFNTHCNERRNSKNDYEGCPYNTNKTLLKVTVKKK